MNRKIIIAAIGFVIAVAIGLHFYVEWEMKRFDASLPTPPAAEEQPGGHWHGDEWHADDAHARDDSQPSVDWQQYTELPELVKPENLGELDPEDPVAKAWAKLDELAENRFAWGGKTHPQTPGLIAQLEWPPPEYVRDEGHGMELSYLLTDIAKRRDPRAIEILVAYQCSGPIQGGPVDEALIALGPPVVPHLIPYLDEALKERKGYLGMSPAANILSQIGGQYRADLGGIVEHIILPKLELLLADGVLDDFWKRDVKEAIACLKR